jgi:hypothetical protein
MNTTPHWPAGAFGSVMSPIQCIVIHETSGVPSYSGINTFVDRYTCMGVEADPCPSGNPHKCDSNRGVGPQYFVEPNGTVYTLIGNANFTGDPRQTAHAGWRDQHINMNPFALGIENADIGDSGITPGAGNGPFWWALSNESTDLTGMKLYLTLLPNNQEDAQLIWIAQFPQRWSWVPPAAPPAPQRGSWQLQATNVTPGYEGAGDIVDGANPANTRHIAGPHKWRNMLFTERNFRTLVLLCRLLAERYGLPRNFPVLPYASADSDRTNSDIFRRLILAEQRRDEIVVQLGTTTATIQANTAQFTSWYNANPMDRWSRLFGAIPGTSAAPASTPVTPCFRGILAHSANGGHPCPGPLFDWHRFAREVWDWWWYPFDFDTTANAASTTLRPYFQARHETPLLEYYYYAVGSDADHNGLHELPLIYERFLLPNATPIYAMANGVVAAARLGTSTTDPAAGGFLLVRHEVFHRTVGNGIDYDRAPTFVWSLIQFLHNPGFNIPAAPPALPAATPSGNPSWLNRFIMRLRECELAVQFHRANPGNAALTRAWGHTPSGAGPRLAIGAEIENDATTYRALAATLSASGVALFPLEAQTNTTPVRVCLGDFLGFPNVMPSGRQGFQMEIFSTDRLNVPGAAQHPVFMATETWWRDATAAVRHEATADADLPPNGIAWHYRLTDFLTWINGITWTSEWEKYEVRLQGLPMPAPPRPITRIVT